MLPTGGGANNAACQCSVITRMKQRHYYFSCGFTDALSCRQVRCRAGDCNCFVRIITNVTFISSFAPTATIGTQS